MITLDETYWWSFLLHFLLLCSTYGSKQRQHSLKRVFQEAAQCDGRTAPCIVWSASLPWQYNVSETSPGPWRCSLLASSIHPRNQTAWDWKELCLDVRDATTSQTCRYTVCDHSEALRSLLNANWAPVVTPQLLPGIVASPLLCSELGLSLQYWYAQRNDLLFMTWLVQMCSRIILPNVLFCSESQDILKCLS